MNNAGISDLVERLTRALPPGLAAAGDELRDNFRAILQARLQELDLVGREEFEVQKALLAKLRQRVVALEDELARLERAGD